MILVAVLVFGFATAVIGAVTAMHLLGGKLGRVMKDMIANMNLSEEQAQWIIRGLER